MENLEQDKTIQMSLTIIFSLGIISVLVYILFGSIYAVYASLGIYAFAFSVMSLFSIRKLFLISVYKQRLKNFEEKATFNESEHNAYNEKKRIALKEVNKTKRSEITKAILAGIVAIFAIVVLVLF